MEYCPIYTEHKYFYDSESSGSDKSVFRCICGKEVIEHEDCGTGA